MRKWSLPTVFFQIVQNDATAIQEAEIQMMLQDVEQVAKLHLW